MPIYCGNNPKTYQKSQIIPKYLITRLNAYLLPVIYREMGKGRYFYRPNPKLLYLTLITDYPHIYMTSQYPHYQRLPLAC